MGLSGRATLAVRIAILALGVASLVSGVGGGLARLGLGTLPGPAVLHGGLMVAGFLGTVISLERAVALGHPLALAAPLAAGLGSLLLLAGFAAAGKAAWIVASLLFVAASIAILRRQDEPHTRLLGVAAAAWAVGNALFALDAPPDTTAAWWFCFLVLTIAAERLEMTRLMRRRALAGPLFVAAAGLPLAGAAATLAHPGAGAMAFGLGLVALAAWLAAFDLARRTVRAEGLARYAAVALLAGYAWLAVGGAAWIAARHGVPQARDLALHALGLGFVFSMILAHAPVIVPAIARVRVRFTAAFYLPLAILHGSVLLRALGGVGDFELRRAAGALNAVALAVFIATLVLSLRRRPAAAPSPAV